MKVASLQSALTPVLLPSPFSLLASPLPYLRSKYCTFVKYCVLVRVQR